MSLVVPTLINEIEIVINAKIFINGSNRKCLTTPEVCYTIKIKFQMILH